jgi:hypothetical protein
MNKGKEREKDEEEEENTRVFLVSAESCENVASSSKTSVESFENVASSSKTPVESFETCCTDCKKSRSPENFIGKSGQKVKTCLICREADSKRKSRPDQREKTRIRNSEKQYSTTSRAKRRAENEQEYLNKNAKVHKIWTDNNKEHVAEYRTGNFPSRFRGIKDQAQKKGIPWNDDLTDDICRNMMESECHYCGFLSKKTLNGIDRMDSMGSYEKANCVSCCGKCNFIKGSLDPTTFVNRCKHISKRFGGKGEYNMDIWSDSYSVSLNVYKKRAVNMGLEFNLTQDQFNHLVNSNCFYCDKVKTNTHRNGVDRMDNKVGYTLDNCVACCGQCNQMKCQLTDADYIECCKRTSKFCIENNIKFDASIPTCLYKIAKRVKQDVPQTKFVISKQPKEKPVREPEIIEPFVPQKRVYTRGSNMPDYITVKLPEYCIYVHESKEKGEGFCCERCHPKHRKDKKVWYTTRSRAVSWEEKYKELMGYLDGSGYTPKKDVEVEKDTRGKNLPDHIRDILQIEELPEFCSYVRASGRGGDGFVCRKTHPKHDKAWNTITSKKVSIGEKYKQLLCYLEDKPYTRTEDVELNKRPKKDHPLENLKLPEHCYYTEAKNGKGDFYTCGLGHPKHNKDKVWQTTSKMNVSTIEKYNLLVAYIEDVN